MKNACALLLCLVIAGCQFSKDSETANTLTVEQRAAMELGYFYGSKTNLAGLPEPSRTKSFAGFDHSNDELIQIFEKLKMDKTTAELIINLTDQAMAEKNPLEAAKKLLKVINTIKSMLGMLFPEGTSQPQIWRIYRIGYALGYQCELAAITSTNNPSEQNLITFTGLTQKMRISLPEDLADSRLPNDIKSLIRDTNIEVNTTEDLDSIVKTSQELYNLIRSEK